MTIFGGLGGAIGGALPPGEPPWYVEPNETILQNTLAKYPTKNLQSAFLKEARARTSHTFVVVPEQGSQTKEEMVGQDDVDTVLNLSVQRVWLRRVDDQAVGMNPPMVLVLFVRARLVEASDEYLWYDQTFVHETNVFPYNVWPYYIRLQETKAYQNLAEQMINELFFKTQTSQQ